MILVLLFLLAPITAYAGGPIVVDNIGMTGVARQWQDRTMVWHSDDGPLSASIDNATARQWVEEAFAAWTQGAIKNASGKNVNIVDLKARYGGSLGKDVNASNYKAFVSSEPGPTAVIFDRDGSILDDAGIDKNSIVGVTQILLVDKGGTKILKGALILSGYLLEAGRLSPDLARAQGLVRASLLHEVGHLLNLDHGQVNVDVALACSRQAECTDGQFIPTMFPELKSPLQGTPTRDDRLALAAIYPAKELIMDFCVIRGRVEDQEGRALRGVNVVAKRVGEGDGLARQDQRSLVSGVLYPGCFNNSDYILYGVVPGKSYQVTYEPLASQYQGKSGFEPLPNPPSGFDSGAIAGPADETMVSCAAAPKTIEMKTARITANNPCQDLPKSQGVASGPSSSVSKPEGASGSCSLLAE